jgi:hypothetical protein
MAITVTIPRIVNSMVSDSAAIAWSKISKVGASIADLAGGLVSLAVGGTGADLSATGGATKFVRQASVGAALTVGTIATTDLPTAIPSTNIEGGNVTPTQWAYIAGLAGNIQGQFSATLKRPQWRMYGQLLAGAALNTFNVNNLQGSTYNSSAGSTINSPVAEGFVQALSGGTGSNTYITTTTAHLPTIVDPTIYFRFKTGSSIAAAVRFYFGLTDTSVPSLSDLTNASNFVCFRYSSTAADPGWVGVCCGATGAVQVTAKVADIAASTHYLLRIRFTNDGATAGFSVNGSAEVLLSTNLPANTTLMRLFQGLTQTAAQGRAWDFYYTAVEWGETDVSTGALDTGPVLF